ncbi:hypothetical protein EWM64_g5932 [Hericium alpestre]|uniref:BAH domain-containing protein n=1 Tax=Hericium alpestre TaxID=135208 RepID=A0A4Y9ZV22_9AGAM|nr:hypothetical protein EWM64_g5932 [Hericium alpestre]
MESSKAGTHRQRLLCPLDNHGEELRRLLRLPKMSLAPASALEWLLTANPVVSDLSFLAISLLIFLLARVVYQVTEDELKEGKDLHVIGETEASDNDDDSDEEDDIPVRVLSDFAVYTLDSQKMVPIAELITADEVLSLYGASGNVRPWVEEEEEETDDGLEEDDTDDNGDVRSGGQRVKLSAILEFSMHHVSEETGMLDRKIYIRTQFAWYILSTPMDLYIPFFAQFWLKHRLLHLIVSHAMENPRITMDQIVEVLNSSEESPGTVSAQDILERQLTEEDLNADDVKSYILATLEDLQAQGIKLGRVPLIRGLFPADTADAASGARLESAVSLPGKRSKVVRSVDRQQDESMVQNLEMEVLKHRNTTVVLPTVKRLADGLFDHPLKVIKNDRAGTARASSNMDVDPPVVHLANPKMTWRERVVGVPGHYPSVKIDGVVYTVGDVVIVEPGFDMDSTRARNAVNESAQSRNSLGNSKWFAKICYMFERDGKKWFHGQWYSHGSKTLLQELAHSRSLYIMNLCDDIELSTVIQKCNVVQLAIDEVEPAEDESSAENNFFESSLSWDEDESAFVELSERSRDEALSRCKPWKRCVPCGLRAGEDLQNKLVVRHNGFAQNGIEYHVNDCVYLYHGRHPDNPYEFGQILDFENLEDVESFRVVVQLLGRWDDVVRRERRDNPNAAPEPKDEVRLSFNS